MLLLEIDRDKTKECWTIQGDIVLREFTAGHGTKDCKKCWLHPFHTSSKPKAVTKFQAWLTPVLYNSLLLDKGMKTRIHA